MLTATSARKITEEAAKLQEHTDFIKGLISAIEQEIADTAKSGCDSFSAMLNHAPEDGPMLVFVVREFRARGFKVFAKFESESKSYWKVSW